MCVVQCVASRFKKKQVRRFYPSDLLFSYGSPGRIRTCDTLINSVAYLEIATFSGNNNEHELAGRLSSIA